MSGFVFPETRTPLASIVIPTHEDREWTLRTLGAVLANSEEPYEVIVVDDTSPDGTSELLAAAVKNIRVLRNAQNVGFGASCNNGAAVARGEFLIFLNSDALVHRGWLTALIEGARRDSRIGAVGPCFLNVDGSVQEAGGLLFRDGWTSAYGNGSPPDRAEFQRPRLVDYVSAACLLVRRSAFNAVGGFDPEYGRMYFEDVDLCLALAAAGWRTRYEPTSLVTHIGGWSSSASDAAGALVQRNRPILVRRWGPLLAPRPPMSERIEEILSARDAPASDRLLVVAPLALEGTQSEHTSLVRRLAMLCPTAHLALIREEAPEPKVDEDLLSLGIETVTGGFDDVERWLTSRPYHYDVVILGSAAHPYAPLIRATQPQAWRVVAAQEGKRDRTLRAAAEAEIRAADAIALPSERVREDARALAPNVPTFLVSHQDDFRELVDLLSHAGVAVAPEHMAA